MDSFGAFADGEWESFREIFSDEHDDHHQGLHFITPSTFCPTSEPNNNESLFYSSNTSSTSFDSNCSTSVFSIPTHQTYFFSDVSNNNHLPLTNDVSMFMVVEDKIGSHGTTFTDTVIMEEACPINQYLNDSENQAQTSALFAAKEQELKRKFDEPAAALFLSTGGEGDRVLGAHSTGTNAKKKPRASRKNVQGTSKKNVAESKRKNQNQNLSPKGNNKGEESMNDYGSSDGQSSTSTYNSEDDNNASQETNNEESKASLALNLNGKQRASRGSATDPQSLYARKRREKINERLKILQNLVPNGTKVDISTMLEDAVHYVKFLQFQIKLLSSDDLWMYAPLAYNGIDVCLNQKISSFL